MNREYQIAHTLTHKKQCILKEKCAIDEITVNLLLKELRSLPPSGSPNLPSTAGPAV
jgi:hypothetical protein